MLGALWQALEYSTRAGCPHAGGGLPASQPLPACLPALLPTCRYVHRVGRTARLGTSGAALLFLLPTEKGYVQHLGAHGLALREQPAVPLVNGLLGADRKVGARNAQGGLCGGALGLVGGVSGGQSYVLGAATARCVVGGRPAWCRLRGGRWASQAVAGGQAVAGSQPGSSWKPARQ